MKSIRLSLLGASTASALVCLSHAVPATFAPQEAAAETATESAACACTCATCVAKHGAKAIVATLAPAPEAPAPKPVPQLSVDIDAEVARILATDLETVELLLADVTNGADDYEAVLEGVVLGIDARGLSGMSDERGYMGISLNMDPDAGGAIVGTVTPGSPAAKAGLLPGDVIMVSEEMPVESADELIATLIDLKVGDTATIEFERGSDERKASIVLASRDAVDGASAQRIIFARPAELVEVAEPEEPIVEDFFAEEEMEVEVVLPVVSRRLRSFGYAGDGNVAEVVDVEVIEEMEEVLPPAPRRVRVRMEREEPGVDALPDGYIEIETRRERRPASDAALRERVKQLEEEVAELTRMVDELRRELNRRNPR